MYMKALESCWISKVSLSYIMNAAWQNALNIFKNIIQNDNNDHKIIYDVLFHFLYVE